MNEVSVNIINQSLNFDFNILHCGKESINEKQLNVEVLDRFSIEYVYEGYGIYTLDKKTFKLKPGDIYISFPNVPIYKHPDKDTNFKHYYVAFIGNNCYEIVQKCSLSKTNPIFSCPESDKPKIDDLFARIYDSVEKNTFTSIAEANIYLLSLFCYLFAKNPQNNIPQKKSTAKEIEEIKLYVRNNYYYGLTVNEISEHFHLARPYLSRLFKKNCGISLKKYINDYCIHQAELLLMYTDSTISDIAIKTGYGNMAVFYRSFKSKIGISPSEYRKQNRNQQP